MITNKNEAKTMVRRISCEIVNTNYSTTTCNSNQKWNNETCQCECKNYRSQKKDYIQSPNDKYKYNDKYLKSIGDTSLIECDEIISLMDVLSTKMTSTIATNVPINSDHKF